MYKDPENFAVFLLLGYTPPTSMCLPWVLTGVSLGLRGIQATVTLGTTEDGCSSPLCGQRSGWDGAPLLSKTLPSFANVSFAAQGEV